MEERYAKAVCCDIGRGFKERKRICGFVDFAADSNESIGESYLKQQTDIGKFSFHNRVES